jgi:hypothetical protein
MHKDSKIPLYNYLLREAFPLIRPLFHCRKFGFIKEELLYMEKTSNPSDVTEKHLLLIFAFSGFS